MRDWAHSRKLGTPADEGGYVFLRQPPASKLANLFRIDVRAAVLISGLATGPPPGAGGGLGSFLAA